MTYADKLRKEGKKEKAKEDTANFRKFGVDIYIISKATGLSINEIEEL